ncbi:MAG TPA: hypothetical protein PK668_17180 [Myxococcota bacterium]|nr:hypothetical protein [Myxococcota bacterium]HRY94894.1 hypothetical protein [Myxococcota bacterium]HSA22663.1 hypothetical protein [Myxococcota bacterium]
MAPSIRSRAARRSTCGLWLFGLALAALAGCGPDAGPDGLAGVSAALYLPQDLAADLVSVTIYAYETDRTTHEPVCDRFLTNSEAYKSYGEQTKATIVFASGDTAELRLPDRGNVWRIYARGYDLNNLPIGHGCIVGVIAVDPDAAEPVQVALTMNRL